MLFQCTLLLQLIMKTLLTLFVLFFSSSVLAEDISDFQIEGMSVGDSLLDYFNKEEINSFRIYEYNDKKFYSMDIINSSLSLKIYDGIQVQIKTDDNNYIIHAITGGLFFEYDEFNLCMNQLNNVKKNILNLLTEYLEEESNYPHPNDVNSKLYTLIIYIDHGEILLQCTQWSKKYAREKNLYHNLRVSILTKDYAHWLENYAYQ